MADGSVRNRTFAEQGKDFRGLKFGTITPTDVDGSVDFDGKLFVFIELKYGQVLLEKGQRLHLERLSQIADRAGARGLSLVARHRTPSVDQIDVARCAVTEVYQRGRWRHPQAPLTVRDAIDRALAKTGLSAYVATLPDDSTTVPAGACARAVDRVELTADDIPWN